MAKRSFDAEAPYQSIRNAARITGLSAFFLRDGCKSGKIPHLKIGGEYRICMKLLLEQLEQEAAANAREVIGWENLAS